MATKKKGILTRSPQWWRHLRDWKRVFWKRERRAAKRQARLLPILALSAAIAATPASADELPRLRSYGAPGDLWRQVERLADQREREADAWRDLERDLRVDRLERRLDALERQPSAYERNKEILR